MKKDASFLSIHISSSLSHLGGLNSYGQPIPNSDDDYLVNHLNNFVTEYMNAFPSRNICLAFIDSSGRNKSVTQFLQPILLPDIEWFPKNPKVRNESALSKSSGKSSSSKSSGRRKEEVYFWITYTLFKRNKNQLTIKLLVVISSQNQMVVVVLKMF